MGTTEDNDTGQLAHAEYWNQRYIQSQEHGDQQLHEWLRSAKELDDFFQSHIFEPKPARSRPLILHLGSGDSMVPEHLAAKGYDNQLCVDFSNVVIESMTKRHAELGLLNVAIRWEFMDVRHMESLPDDSVDVAFDKSTLDVMIYGSPWSPPEDTVRNTGDYLREVSRVLKPGGVYLAITFRQPHFVRPLLTCEGTDWHVRIDHLDAGDGSFGYYGIVCSPAGTEASRHGANTHKS